MLRNTFVHIPGIGLKTEQSLWDGGICSWDIFCDSTAPVLPFGKRKSETLRSYLDTCRDQLHCCNPHFFAGSLPSQLLWRLFPDFRHCAAYIDIETTGLGAFGDHITTAALYDGREVCHYIHGENLDRLPEDLQNFKVLITYNGSCFDLPFIQNYFGIRLGHVHIDLRFMLRSLGYRGGLKGCEKQLGLARHELEGVDGYFAVLLWAEYRRGRNRNALETLLAYNIADTVNLETLMVMAYNLKLAQTPFADLALPPPCAPPISFRADEELIESLRNRFYFCR
jgi:uncharacterized protein